MLMIFTNLSIYITFGFIGYFTGFALTGVFFCIISLTIYILFTAISFNKRFTPLQTGKTSLLILLFLGVKRAFTRGKKSLNINLGLLVIFLLLICILYVVRVNPFIGTDPWLHIFIIRKIVMLGVLPVEEYLGAMGMHIIGAVFQIFSKIDFVYIPIYFTFFNSFVSGLIIYNLAKIIFKNGHIAIFGVFLLNVMTLGFTNMIYQYWPAGFAFTQCLVLFFLLYHRLNNFISLKPPHITEITSELPFYYALGMLLFISSLFTHSLITMIMVFSYLPIYFLYFLKDKRRGFDLILILSMILVFIVFLNLNISTGHFYIFRSLSTIPLGFYLISGIVGVPILIYLIWRIRKSIIFSKGRYSLAISGIKSNKYKTVEEKVIIPLALVIISLFTLLFFLGNLFLLNLDLTFILSVVEILLAAAFSIWGLVVFQKIPRGKPLYIWGLFFILILGCVYLIDFLTVTSLSWERVLYLMSPAIMFGFLSYFHKLIKSKTIQTSRAKIFTLFVVAFSLIATYSYEVNYYDLFLLKNREISALRWNAQYNSKTNILLTEFGWDYVFVYFYTKYNADRLNKTSKEIVLNFDAINLTKDFFPPSNHIGANNTNILNELKRKYNTNVYILFEGEYLINRGGNLIGKLSHEEELQYYQVDYLDKIYTSRTEGGEEVNLFWVI